MAWRLSIHIPKSESNKSIMSMIPFHGTYRKWHGNGVLQITGEFVNGLFEGAGFIMMNMASLIGEGKYEAGRGEQRFWIPDGSLYTRTQYVNNLKHGKEYYYRPDGEVDYVVEYEYGEPVVE